MMLQRNCFLVNKTIAQETYYFGIIISHFYKFLLRTIIRYFQGSRVTNVYPLKKSNHTAYYTNNTKRQPNQ